LENAEEEEMANNNQKIIDVLNEDRTYELAAIVQYMGHHYTAEGLESPAIIDIFKDTGIAEMRHAESLGERINYLGGQPTTIPKEIVSGGDIKKMMQDDLQAEYGAIERYKKHIKLCEELGDTTTRRMLEDILAQEEDHANTWETVLMKKK
jgi:bacterioferritin